MNGAPSTRPLVGKERVLGDGDEGAHHVVGFVLEDVAVVEVFAGVAYEGDDDAGDCAGWALDYILPASFEGGRGGGGFGETEALVYDVLGAVEGAAVEDLEAHEVEVHGVGVFG